MRTLRDILLCALLLAMITLVVAGVIFIRAATETVRQAPAVIERQIAEQGEETRRAALRAIQETRAELLGEVARTRRDVLTRVDRLANIADARTARGRCAIVATERDDRHGIGGAAQRQCRADGSGGAGANGAGVRNYRGDAPTSVGPRGGNESDGGGDGESNARGGARCALDGDGG